VPRILAIYPEPGRRRTMKRALAGTGIEIVTAPTASVGVAKLKQGAVDLVMFDLDEGGLSVEDLERILPELGTVPSVALGGDSRQIRRVAGAGRQQVAHVDFAASGAGAEADFAALVQRHLGGVAPRVVRSTAADGTPRAVTRRQRGRVDAVAIGISTGGPNALFQMLPALPADLPVPVFIVQHMPEHFLEAFAGQLDARSPMKVQLGRDGDAVEPGTAYVAPGNVHMVVSRTTPRTIEILDGPPEHNCRPAVDPLFRSIASTYGAHALAVVMTGMGADGSIGIVDVAGAGGQVVIQDEATSVVWGMPGAVARSGVDYSEYPLDQIAGAIVRAVAVERPGVGA